MNNLPLTFVGNLIDDPALRFTSQGIAVAKLTVAHNPRTLDKTSNEWRDGEPTFLDCAVWRDLAEHVAESLKKGHRVIVVGNLRTQRWESTGTGKTPAGEKLSRLQLDVLAIGPDLTWATATVNKATRTRAGQTSPDDPWTGASKTRPTSPAAGGSFDDEPPF